MNSSPRPLPWLRIGTVVSLTLVTSLAMAFEDGITGRSGKQGTSCNQCHNGGVAPTVALTGPLTLDAGAKGVYTFTVTTPNVATGMNAAATGGAVLAANQTGGNVQTLDEDGELEVTHTAPMLTTDAGGGNGISTYKFELTAPAFGGPIKLFAAGNAVNNNGATDGDNSARQEITITINGPARPPDGGVDSGNPGPGPNPTATAAPTTTVTAAPTNTSPTTPGADAGGARPGAKPAAEDDSGCSIGWADRSSLPGGAMIGTLLALAAFGRARARRRKKK
jgi:hypothetical protein